LVDRLCWDSSVIFFFAAAPTGTFFLGSLETSFLPFVGRGCSSSGLSLSGSLDLLDNLC